MKIVSAVAISAALATLVAVGALLAEDSGTQAVKKSATSQRATTQAAATSSSNDAQLARHWGQPTPDVPKVAHVGVKDMTWGNLIDAIVATGVPRQAFSQFDRSESIRVVLQTGQINKNAVYGLPGLSYNWELTVINSATGQVEFQYGAPNSQSPSYFGQLPGSETDYDPATGQTTTSG